MKILFKALRAAIGPLVLLSERLTTPKGIVRPPPEQEAVDLECRRLALYQFGTCPFCVKVRKEMRRLSLDIELRDAGNDARHRQDMLDGGGQLQVPCLRIAGEDGSSRWMYESADIVGYLRQRFA